MQVSLHTNVDAHKSPLMMEPQLVGEGFAYAGCPQKRPVPRGDQLGGLEEEGFWSEMLECWRQTEKEFLSDPDHRAGARRRQLSALTGRLL